MQSIIDIPGHAGQRKRNHVGVVADTSLVVRMSKIKTYSLNSLGIIVEKLLGDLNKLSESVRQ